MYVGDVHISYVADSVPEWGNIKMISSNLLSKKSTFLPRIICFRHAWYSDIIENMLIDLWYVSNSWADHVSIPREIDGSFAKNCVLN